MHIEEKDTTDSIKVLDTYIDELAMEIKIHCSFLLAFSFACFVFALCEIFHKKEAVSLIWLSFSVINLLGMYFSLAGLRAVYFRNIRYLAKYKRNLPTLLCLWGTFYFILCVKIGLFQLEFLLLLSIAELGTWSVYYLLMIRAQELIELLQTA